MFLTLEGQGLNYLNFSPVCNTELTEITDHCLNSTAEIYFFIFFLSTIKMLLFCGNVP